MTYRNLIALFFLLVIPLTISTTVNKTIHTSMVNLTDANFDTLIKEHSPERWIVVFTSKECSFCRSIIRMIDEKIAPQFQDDHETKFGIVNCDTNVWTAGRFDITSLPLVILIQNGRMFSPKSLTTEEEFIVFVKQEKLFENSKEFPKAIRWSTMFSKLKKEILDGIRKNVQKQLDKRSIKLTWTNKLTYGFFGCLCVFCSLFQILIYRRYFMDSKGSNNHLKKD